MWNHVISHFNRFLSELELKPEERADADAKADRIARCLWKKFWTGEFDPGCYVKVGSYGKGTATRPPSDLDMLFLLPVDEYPRIEALQGNKQSQLLQQVKDALEDTFPTTDLSADGQVVLAPFQSYNVEIIPAFRWNDSLYITAHTADGGSWRRSNPVAEYQFIQSADAASRGKATHLIKMLKAWKRECSVEIKSISLEVLACEFVNQWAYRHQTVFYYDWMVRDFFEFMLRYVNGWTRVIGTDEIIQLGDVWASACRTAYNRACKAERYEHADDEASAADEWRKIFGLQFAPLSKAVESFLKALAAAR